MRGHPIRSSVLAALAVLLAAGPAARALAGPRVQVFLVPKDDDSATWATKIDGMIETSLRKHHDLRVVDLGKVFGVKAPASVDAARKQAQGTLQAGIGAFNNVQFGAAVTDLKQTLKVLRKQAAWLNKIPEYPRALAYLAATDVLAGNTQAGKAVYRELLLYDPGYTLNTKVFDPSLRHILKQVRNGIKNGSVGSVSVYSKPSGGRIYLDGKQVGFTPASLDQIPTGNHVMRVETIGTRPWGRVVDITPTEDTTIHARLMPTDNYKKVKIILGEVRSELAEGKVGTGMVKLGSYVGLNWVVYGLVSHNYGNVTLTAWMVSVGAQKRLATGQTNFPDGDFDLQANIDGFVGKLVKDAMANHNHMVTSDDPLDSMNGQHGWFSSKGTDGKKRSLQVDKTDKQHRKSKSSDPLDNMTGTEGW